MDHLSYVADMLRELHQMADRCQAAGLAETIDLAAREAEREMARRRLTD